MKKMGISEEDLENISNEMLSAFGGAEEADGLTVPEDGGDEDDDGRTATFPFLNKLFGGQGPSASADDGARTNTAKEEKGKAPAKRKFLENYCRPEQRDRAHHPDPQPPAEEQPLPHRRTRRG